VIRARLLLALALALAAACAKPAPPDPRYRPTENVLEAIAVLRLHVDDDTYRFPPARDFSGKNVYRASLARLEALEQIHSEKFKSGYLLDALLFAKGRALERITEYALAAAHYERVAELDSPLAPPARDGRAVCLRLAAAQASEVAPTAPVDAALAGFDAPLADLEALLREVEGSHYEAVVREEIERADLERARHFAARRRLEPGLDALALQQYQRLIQRHRDSKFRSRHLLELADLYAEFSHDYVSGTPPVSLGFDTATFDELAHGATRLYEAVSQQDGAVEKIEASRKLEAFLAFTLQVHEEKLQR
jgi:hypothetical protein